MKRDPTPEQDAASNSRFPLTDRVLCNIRRQGFTPERTAIALQVFGSVIAHETGVSAAKLLAIAEQHPQESVEELIENIRLEEQLIEKLREERSA
jgi:hypothetical protein